MQKKDEKNIIQVKDDTNEHLYFTMIPNIVIQQSDHTELALYVHLRKLAGSGLAYPSRNTLMKLLGISKPTLLTKLNILIDRGWIENAGSVPVKTSGGDQFVIGYKILDIWAKNMSFFSKGVKNNTPLRAKGGKKYSSKGVKNRPPNKNHINNNHINTVADKTATVDGPKKMEDSDPMGLEDFKVWCTKSPLRHIRIIADYADEKKLTFNTVGQWREFIKRNVRPAKILSPYTDEQISKAMTEIEKSKYISRWTLETLIKYLDQ